MTMRTLLTAAGIVVLLAAPVGAQTTGGSFDSLSPGNQKIANALFSAQSTTGTPLTRNQIADLKKTEGWGKVFKQMKADGLVQAKNLGQVVSGYEHQLHASRASTTSAAATTRTARTPATTSRRGRTMTASTSSRMRGGAMGGRHFAAGRRAAHAFGHPAMGGGFGRPAMGGGFGPSGVGHGGMGEIGRAHV